MRMSVLRLIVGLQTCAHSLHHEAVVFAIVKVAAVAVTMAGRMGGGVFSPSLMVLGGRDV